LKVSAKKSEAYEENMNAQSLANFKSAVRKTPGSQAAAPNVKLLKASAAPSEALVDRRIKFTISTDAVDLDNDTVNQSGWDLSIFKTNPVVLFMHNSDGFPVGKCVGINVEDGKLKATVEFLPADNPANGPVAEGVYQMCRDGFLSATSVGFLPTSYEISAERTDENDWWPAIDFTAQKLLEFSIVTVPANSEALIEPGQQAAAPTPDLPDETNIEPAAVVPSEPEAPEEDAAAMAALTAKAALAATFKRASAVARFL
jgi:HK97 family phage prohead protease